MKLSEKQLRERSHITLSQRGEGVFEMLMHDCGGWGRDRPCDDITQVFH